MQDAAKSVARSLFRATAAFPFSRRLLNALYLKLSASQRALFHQRFAKAFRNGTVQGKDGRWKVIFARKEILMPLRSGGLWLDWDNAVSIVGHDIEVKETYQSLINSHSDRPELFIDIGANYGTHSLLFLVHDIETITFEPNKTCHEVFRRMCALNHVSPNLKPVALGERLGHVEFSYPRQDTWLGSTNPQVIDKLSGSKDLVSEQVEQKMLDDFLAEIGNKRALIKIDTEGNELSVLNGAKNTLEKARPRIIFECWGEDEKTGIFNLLSPLNYSIHALPWSPRHHAEPLGEQEFMASSSTNFIAIPVKPR